MPFLAYVHAHEPEQPAEPRRYWEPNWRLWRWLAAAALVAYGSAHTTGALAALLTIAAFVCVCQAGAAALPYGDGLRQHKQ